MLFISQTISNPKSTGAITKSSGKLAKLIVSKANIGKKDMVVELGPGTGVFTKEIIKYISKQSNLMTIEINPKFAETMKKKYPEVNTISGSAENISFYLNAIGKQKCDRIISGLPWTAFDVELQDKLLKSSYDSLKKGGLFLTFAYKPFNRLPNGKKFKSKLEMYFTKIEITESVINFPQAFVYVCTK